LTIDQVVLVAAVDGRGEALAVPVATPADAIIATSVKASGSTTTRRSTAIGAL
jgi:hypothetical protein